MRKIFGREVGVASRGKSHDRIDRLVWLDLTAGNGLVEAGMDWGANCSPGISAYHARDSVKPVNVALFEIQRATYDRLLDSLGTNLPILGYSQTGDAEWRCGNASIRALCADGSQVDVSHLRCTDSVLVSNDPNAISSWAMRPNLAAEISARTWSFRSISTMGCNVGGLLRLTLEERLCWYELIQHQAKVLPSHRDLFLAAIEGDSSKWAYLLCEPKVWRPKVEAMAATAFARHGYQLETAWLRSDPAAFHRTLDGLFLTRKERGEA